MNPDAGSPAQPPQNRTMIARRLRRAECPIRADPGEAETGQRNHAGRAHQDRLEPAACAFRPRDVRIPLTGLALAAACLAGFTTACSGQGPADGTLTGHLYGVGGPTTATAPGSPRPWPGTLTVTGPGVHLDVPVAAGGAYSVRVPPGRYTVAGHSPLYDSGTALCRAAGIATVTSGHTTKADVLCQMS